MINPLDFYKTYTLYDGMRFVFISLIIIGMVMVHAYYFTRSRKIQVVNVLSWFGLELLYILAAIAYKELFHMTVTVSIQGVYWGLLMLQSLNLLIITDLYAKESKIKEFDIDHISRKHFEFTVNLAALIALITTAGAIFIQGTFVWELVLFAVVAITSLAVTHIVVRTQLKEPFKKPKK